MDTEKENRMLKKLIERRSITQVEAAELLSMTLSNIGALIRKGKIEAEFNEKRRPKPYLDSVLNYKPNPNKKKGRLKK